MVPLTAYCDDSGRGNKDRVAVVAGFLGSAQMWSRFAPAWKRACEKEGITVAHRSDLENFRGEFDQAKGWNPKRRAAFVQKLHKIIKRHTYSAIGVGVIKAGFEQAMPAAVKRLYRGPFGWCAQTCIVAARAWCDDHESRGPISWVFEAGTAGAQEIGAMFSDLYNDPSLREAFHVERDAWAFQGKEISPLQAADVIAYEIFKEVENGVLDKHEYYPKRRSAIDLFRPGEGRYCQYWDKARLSEWAKRWIEQYGQ